MLMLLLMLLATLLLMLLATLLAMLLTLLAMPPMAPKRPPMALLMLLAMPLLTLLPRSEHCAVLLGRPENDRAKPWLRAVVLFCACVIVRRLLGLVTAYGAMPVDRKKAMARSMDSARGVDGIPSSVRALLPSKYAPRCRYCMLLSVARGSS